MGEALILLAIVFMALGILIALFRFLKGPHGVDRIVAFDAMTIISISLIVTIGHFADRLIYLDVAVVYSLLSFLGVVVVARYIERGL